MKQLKYVNSQNETIDFRAFETQIFEGNFHTYEWKYEGTSQDYGMDIEEYTKDPLELNMIVAARSADRAQQLNRILEIAEYDIVNKTRGKLYWGDYYIQCNIISATTTPSEEFFGAQREMKIVAPRAFWIKEAFRQFFAGGSETEEGGLNYPYDYPYNYAGRSKGAARWSTGHFAPSEFKLTIYGPCVNPRINIAGHPYQILDTVETGEYATINSRDLTITKNRSNGTVGNIWDKQAKEDSVFQKIPGGTIDIGWNGNFGFDLTLYQERSEPAW